MWGRDVILSLLLLYVGEEMVVARGEVLPVLEKVAKCLPGKMAVCW
jgi:hypothetical protein